MNNDLKFSGSNPVIINYNGSVDDIYAPVKTSSCDVNIVSDRILDDLYTPNKDGIYLQVKKTVPHREKVVRYIEHGSADSSFAANESSRYTIYNNNRYFYTDVNGAFRFTGKVESEGVISYENLTQIGDYYWRPNNAWNLAEGEKYFYDSDGNSYKTWEDEDDIFMISKWNGSGWGEGEEYYMTEDSVDFICYYPNENIVHYLDGTTEMIFGKKRYIWDSTNIRWLSISQYINQSGGTYTATYGKWYLRVKNRNGVIVDAIMMSNVETIEELHTEWIVSLDRANNTFRCMIPITVGTKDMSRIFTGDSGDVYYLDSNGDVYCWSWESDDWIKWIKIRGDITDPDSFILDYVMPGSSKTIIIKYDNTKFYNLTHLIPPVCYTEWAVIPGEYDISTLWEGYKIPNTFSQDVSLNLDEISMTCIDPVALLKYVKIDKVMTKPAMVTYKEIIGKSLAYVMLNSNTLRVERNITYGTSTHSETNNILNLMCQISNFWDEGNEPSTLYEVIEELLRPFCLTFEYVNDTYWIFNQTRTSNRSVYDEYTIEQDGTLTIVENQFVIPVTYDMEDNDWISNNTETATIEIGSTYSKVTAVASTSTPTYSSMVTDKVDYSNRDQYEIAYLNVQRNKSKGYRYMNVSGSQYQRLLLDDTDYWFYLWNGCYTDSDYELISYTMLVNGWLNINKAFEYLNGTTGNPNDYGSILNFYGGANNPTATGKSQAQEKPVEIKSRITAYAADNGVPPEFLEASDLNWQFKSNYSTLNGESFNPQIIKSDKTNSRYGSDIQPSGTHRVVYHQEYKDTVLNGLNSQTLDIRLTQSYSRTGIDVPINVINNNSSTNNYFIMRPPDFDYYYRPVLYTSDLCYFPQTWNWDNVIVDYQYFARYATGHRDRITPVWDRRRIDIYIDLGDSVLQFNGKEWVEASSFSESNSFYLMKMMNYEKLYHTDYSYNVIETSDYDPNNPEAGGHYSLTDENFSYKVDTWGGVVKNTTNFNKYCPPYRAETNEWSQWINDCSEGFLSLVLPTVEGGIADVIVNITSSSLLGSTGGTAVDTWVTVPVYYQFTGTGRIYDSLSPYDVALSPQNIGPLYGTMGTIQSMSPGLRGASTDFLPANVSYVKGEHLDLNISMNIPKSNLGQMFSQSDIKYIIDSNNNYNEEYEMHEFKENTYNPLVNDSFSYLLFDSLRAQPDEFVINGLAVRPECYTVQAYMNWLSTIRKSYRKTLKTLKIDARPFNNFKNFIISPEVGDNKLMVVSDSWDLKSDRHSVAAIESQGLDVDEVTSYNVLELPRKARNERWNLPTAKKK